MGREAGFSRRQRQALLEPTSLKIVEELRKLFRRVNSEVNIDHRDYLAKICNNNLDFKELYK